MADATTGLILAALDVDVDNGASWNRWYDLEHLAPNIALAGISTGRRYVAPPPLHQSRRVRSDEAVWGGGRSVYLTWYATTIDPTEAITTMTVRRDELEAEGRMDGAGVRTVRTGDALDLIEVCSDPALRLADDDIAHVGHAGLRLLIGDRLRSTSTGPGVIAAMRFQSRFHAGRIVEVQMLDHAASDGLDELRTADPADAAAIDAGFDSITPLSYPFLAAIEASELPRRVAG